jgi:hypothetical protein
MGARVEHRLGVPRHPPETVGYLHLDKGYETLLEKKGDDFAWRRVFGPDEKRQIRDMRRAGAQEALAGGVSLTDLATTMVNDIDDNSELLRIYGSDASSIGARNR